MEFVAIVTAFGIVLTNSGVNSAHRDPEKLLTDLKGYEESGDRIVYITIAGLSDALSSIVAGYTTNPVIACPPDIEKFGFPKIFSSIKIACFAS